MKEQARSLGSLLGMEKTSPSSSTSRVEKKRWSPLLSTYDGGWRSRASHPRMLLQSITGKIEQLWHKSDGEPSWLLQVQACQRRIHGDGNPHHHRRGAPDPHLARGICFLRRCRHPPTATAATCSPCLQAPCSYSSPLCPISTWWGGTWERGWSATLCRCGFSFAIDGLEREGIESDVWGFEKGRYWKKKNWEASIRAVT
jgi:hypothetical protein